MCISFKVLANENTLLRTHCCRHKCFPVCPRAQHLLRTQILCPGQKMFLILFSVTNVSDVSRFAQPKKQHGQQCVRNNVSSFTRAFTRGLSILHCTPVSHGFLPVAINSLNNQYRWNIVKDDLSLSSIFQKGFCGMRVMINSSVLLSDKDV